MYVRLDVKCEDRQHQAGGNTHECCILIAMEPLVATSRVAPHDISPITLSVGV